MIDWDARVKTRSCFMVAMMTLILSGVWRGNLSAADPDYMAAMGIMQFDGSIDAPNFMLPTPDGKMLQLSDFKGKVILLNFWASWCPHCTKERASLKKLFATFHSKGLVVLGVSIDRLPPHRMLAFLKQHEVPYPVALDLQYQAAHMYGVQGTPTTYLISRQGKVVGGTAGPKNWSSEMSKALFTRLLEEPS